MAALDNCKVGLAAVLAALLLWKPAIISAFPGLLYTTDLTTVNVVDSCIEASGQTVFVFCLVEVLAACVCLKSFVLPAVFGEAMWTAYDDLKRQKMVGFFVKIGVRVAVAVQILFLVLPWLSVKTGLFGSFNIMQAYNDMVRLGRVDTCAAIGMSLNDAIALRSWTLARYNMMAVMVWELAFIPDLPLDAWLHHLFVIFAVVIGSDPRMVVTSAGLQPFVDSVGFFLILGAAFAALVEAAVLMYHFSAPAALSQARWMLASMAMQVGIVVIFFGIFPIAFVYAHWDRFGGFAFGLMGVLAFLVMVEIKMVVVKWDIVKSAWRKAAKRQSQSARQLTHGDDINQEAGHRARTFHHSLFQEAIAIGEETPLGEEDVEMNQTLPKCQFPSRFAPGSGDQPDTNQGDSKKASLTECRSFVTT